LKQLVWHRTYDLIVHGGSSQGTGVGATTQSVYRLLRGNMYKVFDVVEESWNLSSAKSAKVSYPTEAGDAIVVRSVGARCEAFHWKSEAFAFLSVPCASK